MTKIPNAKKKMMMMMMKQKQPNLFAIRRVQSDKTDGKQQKGFGMINIPVTKQYNFDIEDSVSHRHQDRV